MKAQPSWMTETIQQVMSRGSKVWQHLGVSGRTAVEVIRLKMKIDPKDDDLPFACGVIRWRRLKWHTIQRYAEKKKKHTAFVLHHVDDDDGQRG